MRKRIAIALGAAAVALVGAGCGGSNNSSSNDSGSTSAAGGKSQPAKTTGTSMQGMKGMKGMKGMAAVMMQNIKFSPANITVKAGETVMWTNMDSVAHDVTKTGGPGKKFSSGTGNLNKGDTYSVKLTTPGKITYVCTVHPGMQGTITVK